MGLHLPRHPQRSADEPRRGRWFVLVALAAVALVTLSGCSSADESQWKRFGMPNPATKQGEATLNLWQGAWIAALATGVVVWGLMFYVCIRYRRRSDDEIPIQTRYNLPLEIFYTIAPVVMVVVFFSHTVTTENIALDDSVTPDNTIEVVGQQWQWTFNYGVGPEDASANAITTDHKFAYKQYTTESGTASYVPTLYLPVDETTRFNLWSPDVIHDFGVPAFLMKMDIIPGRVNHYQLTPTRIGDYRGACYELCGVYHSRMIFHVKVVSQADYAAYLLDKEKTAGVTDAPLLGGSDAYTEAGLETPEGVTQ